MLSLLAAAPYEAHSAQKINEAASGHARKLQSLPDLSVPYGQYIGNVTSMGDPITKTTTLGPIIGRADSATGIERYFGVPVAPSAAGMNRWKYPEHMGSYTWTIPIDTLEESVCMEFSGLVGTEDCIKVDIQTKTGLSGAPVACWVHGGGFTSQDSGSAATRTAAYYAKGGPTASVVQVMMHYRLAYLGWGVYDGAEVEMAGTGYTSGNYGMSDIIHELKWIQANIATFGGDAARISLYGESAGGAHVASLLASPQTEGIVKNFILESPYITMGDAAYSYLARKQISEIVPRSTAGMTGCVFNTPNSSVTLACMRAGPAILFDGALNNGTAWDEIYSVGGPAGFAVSAWGMVNGAGCNAWPVVDGYFLSLPPSKAYAAGTNALANVIIGHNVDEQATFYNSGYFAGAVGNYFPAAMASTADTVFPLAANADRVGILGSYLPAYPDISTATPENLDTYMGNNFIVTAMNTLDETASITAIWIQAATYAQDATYLTNFDSLYAAEQNAYVKAVKPGSDGWLTACVTKAIAQIMSAPMRRPGTVFRYLFAESGPDEFSNIQPGWGACHGCELTFVLGMYENGDPATGSYPLSSYNNPLTIGLGMGSYIDFGPTYSSAEIALGTTMKHYWVNFFSTGNPNGAGVPTWDPVVGSTMNVMVFDADFTSAGAGGALLNPCLQTSPCVMEPALNYRKAYGDFMNTGVYTTPDTCTGPVGGFTHETVGSLCCPACPTGRRSTLFGAPVSRPAGCPACP